MGNSNNIMAYYENQKFKCVCCFQLFKNPIKITAISSTKNVITLFFLNIKITLKTVM